MNLGVALVVRPGEQHDAGAHEAAEVVHVPVRVCAGSSIPSLLYMAGAL